MSRTRRSYAKMKNDSDRLRRTMKRDVAANGASTMSLMICGAEFHLVPAIGRAMANLRLLPEGVTREDLVAHGSALERVDHDNQDDPYVECCDRAGEKAAFDYLADNPALLTMLRSGEPSRPHNPIESLGLSMIGWAEVGFHGAPAGYGHEEEQADRAFYERDTEFDDFARHVREHGEVLVAASKGKADPVRLQETMSWVGKYLHTLWD